MSDLQFNLPVIWQPLASGIVQKSEMRKASAAKSEDAKTESKIKAKGKPRSETTYSVFCCQGSDCTKAGAKEILKEFRDEIKDSGLKRRTHIVKTQCAGLCKCAPVVAVFAEQPQGVQPLVWYGKLKLKDARRIVDEHLKNGEIVEEKLIDPD